MGRGSASGSSSRGSHRCRTPRGRRTDPWSWRRMHTPGSSCVITEISSDHDIVITVLSLVLIRPQHHHCLSVSNALNFIPPCPCMPGRMGIRSGASRGAPEGCHLPVDVAQGCNQAKDGEAVAVHLVVHCPWGQVARRQFNRLTHSLLSQIEACRYNRSRDVAVHSYSFEQQI